MLVRGGQHTFGDELCFRLGGQLQGDACLGECVEHRQTDTAAMAFGPEGFGVDGGTLDVGHGGCLVT